MPKHINAELRCALSVIMTELEEGADVIDALELAIQVIHDDRENAALETALDAEHEIRRLAGLCEDCLDLPTEGGNE